jgi:hypothetical protein
MPSLFLLNMSFEVDGRLEFNACLRVTPCTRLVDQLQLHAMLSEAFCIQLYTGCMTQLFIKFPAYCYLQSDDCGIALPEASLVLTGWHSSGTPSKFPVQFLEPHMQRSLISPND